MGVKNAAVVTTGDTYSGRDVGDGGVRVGASGGEEVSVGIGYPLQSNGGCRVSKRTVKGRAGAVGGDSESHLA